MEELVAGNRDVIRSVRQGGGDFYMIDISIVKPREGFNEARLVDPKYPEYVRALADSMKANGWMRAKPLIGVITPEGICVPSDGHTRYEAALLAIKEGAPINLIPFLPEEKGTNDKDRTLNVIRHNSGNKLTPLGEAIQIKKAMGFGSTEQQVADELGYSVTTVNNLLTLLGAPSAVRNMVATGQVAATLATKIVKAEGSKAVETLATALETAKAAGKEKVTAKHVPGLKKPKAVILPDASAILEEIKTEPAARGRTSPENIQDVLDAIRRLEKGE
jgi:ParB family transcriptional regulator, chromosome partitioning protein